MMFLTLFELLNDEFVFLFFLIFLIRRPCTREALEALLLFIHRYLDVGGLTSDFNYLITNS